MHLRQLLFDPAEPLPSLTLDDFDNRVFAMEPSCHHNLWSKMTNRSGPERLHEKHEVIRSQKTDNQVPSFKRDLQLHSVGPLRSCTGPGRSTM